MHTNESAIKSTINVMIITLIIRFLGFIKDMVLANYYGASFLSDVFVIAISIPTVFFSGIGGALAVAYTPIYLKAAKNNGEVGGNFNANICTFLIGICFIISLSVTLFPATITKAFAGMASDTTQKLVMSLIRIMIWSSIPIILQPILSGYLQIQGLYIIAIFPTIFINLLEIVGIIVAYHIDIYMMALMYILGYILCCLILFGACQYKGFNYYIHFDFKDARLKDVIVFSTPVFVNSIIVEVNTMLDKLFASSLSAGAISGLSYANKLTDVVKSVLINSIIAVTYPYIARKHQQHDKKGLSSCVIKGILCICALVIPLGAGTFILSKPIVTLLYARGKFGVRAISLTAESLRFYAIGYLFVCLTPFLIRVIYILGKRKEPVVIATFSVILNVMLNAILIQIMQNRGLALATSISSALQASLLLIIIFKELKNLTKGYIIREIVKILTATVLMVISIWVVERVLLIDIVLKLFLEIFISVVVYVAVLCVLKFELLKHVVIHIVHKKI